MTTTVEIFSTSQYADITGDGDFIAYYTPGRTVGIASGSATMDGCNGSIDGFYWRGGGNSLLRTHYSHYAPTYIAGADQYVECTAFPSVDVNNSSLFVRGGEDLNWSGVRWPKLMSTWSLPSLNGDDGQNPFNIRVVGMPTHRSLFIKLRGGGFLHVMSGTRNVSPGWMQLAGGGKLYEGPPYSYDIVSGAGTNGYVYGEALNNESSYVGYYGSYCAKPTDYAESYLTEEEYDHVVASPTYHASMIQVVVYGDDLAPTHHFVIPSLAEERQTPPSIYAFYDTDTTIVVGIHQTESGIGCRKHVLDLETMSIVTATVDEPAGWASTTNYINELREGSGIDIGFGRGMQFRHTGIITFNKDMTGVFYGTNHRMDYSTAVDTLGFHSDVFPIDSTGNIVNLAPYMFMHGVTNGTTDVTTSVGISSYYAGWPVWDYYDLQNPTRNKKGATAYKDHVLNTHSMTMVVDNGVMVQADASDPFTITTKNRVYVIPALPDMSSSLSDNVSTELAFYDIAVSIAAGGAYTFGMYQLRFTEFNGEPVQNNPVEPSTGYYDPTNGEPPTCGLRLFKVVGDSMDLVFPDPDFSGVRLCPRRFSQVLEAGEYVLRVVNRLKIRQDEYEMDDAAWEAKRYSSFSDVGILMLDFGDCRRV